MINATQLKTGMVIIHNGDLCRVMKLLHITPGNWRGMVQTTLRNLKTGAKLEHRFRSEDRVETAYLDQQEMEYLYSDGDFHYFMNTQTYEQTHLDEETLGEAINYLIANIRLQVDFYEGRAVGVELPKTVDLTVVETEPAMKGATATGSPKPAKVETGLVVQVPQFVETGEVIRVDTSTGSYLERAKK